MTEERWRDGAAYPNKYDRVCKECGKEIPRDGRDYFYRKTPGGDYESMCRSCMQKLPTQGDESDAMIGTLIRIAEALEKLAAQGAE